MKYVLVRVFRFNPEIPEEEVIRRNRQLSMHLYQQQPGFVAYEAVHAGGDRWISITTWESQQQAEAANERIGAFVSQTPDLLEL